MVTTHCCDTARPTNLIWCFGGQVAAAISLLNAARLADGKPRLGAHTKNTRPHGPLSPRPP